MNIKEKLNEFAAKINANPEHIEDFTRCYHVQLKPEGHYELMFSDGQVNVHHEPQSEGADCTLKLSEKNFIKLIEGDWDPTKAFMMGQLKVEGKLGNALKLHQIVKTYNQ
ncbi:SCP2 sterol-binding domain-containing protein [Salicibibacter kimchii]|uniref:Sterol carrier protein n=1 Tax=Salicibibacter kimchii TaxID=2099786 RepID=A0A345C234_9BACI|nr:SCP2 sterol-binding domain-containing protein [Salicibibacter kimchii]AXF57265.1 sterol carrier protein [Salicibibacter kimchii]